MNELNYAPEPIQSKSTEKLRALISVLRTRRYLNFQAAKRMKNRFEKQNAEWLNLEFKIDSCRIVSQRFVEEERDIIANRGRPLLDFEDKWKRL